MLFKALNNKEEEKTEHSFSNPYFVQWFRVHSYPPNGVMPSVTFGSIA